MVTLLTIDFYQEKKSFLNQTFVCVMKKTEDKQRKNKTKSVS